MDITGQSGLTLIDWLIVVTYASSTIGLGY